MKKNKIMVTLMLAAITGFSVYVGQNMLPIALFVLYLVMTN